MIKQIRFLFLALLAGLLLAACSGNGGSESAGEGSATGSENDPLGSGPVLPPESTDEGPVARGATSTTSDVAAVCLSAEEGKLVRAINEYRATKNLPPVQASKSLTLVAQQHAWDSATNRNAWPAPPAGQECNLHSWSPTVNPALQEGTWTQVCYTSDHAQAAGMWSKPREIAGYPADGIENSFWSSGTATAAGALEGWKNSAGHNAVITEQNGWGPFNAMGVGMSGGIAHLWFGRVADPAGEAQLCGGGNVAAPPTAVPTVEPTAVPPTDVPTAEPTAVPPTAEPTAVPPTAEPTAVPPTVEPTAVPPTAEPTAVPPTAEPTAVPPTAEPTAVPPTAEPTAVPPTAEPTAVPPTAEPTAVPPTVEPTAVPSTGEVLNANGEVTAGGSVVHTFDVVQGRIYTILITPAADFDADPSYSCSGAGFTRSGSFDVGFAGEAETTSYSANGDGSCTLTVAGYGGSTGAYNVLVTAQ